MAAGRGVGPGPGAAFQHVLTASTVMYDESEQCPMYIRLRAWADTVARQCRRLLGIVLEAVSAYGVRLLRIIMKNRVRPSRK